MAGPAWPFGRTRAGLRPECFWLPNCAGKARCCCGRNAARFSQQRRRAISPGGGEQATARCHRPAAPISAHAVRGSAGELSRGPCAVPRISRNRRGSGFDPSAAAAGNRPRARRIWCPCASGLFFAELARPAAKRLVSAIRRVERRIVLRAESDVALPRRRRVGVRRCFGVRL